MIYALSNTTNSNIPYGTLGGILAILIISLLSLTRKAHATTEGSVKVIRYGNGFRFFGWLALCGEFAIFKMAINIPASSIIPGAFITAVGFTLFLILFMEFTVFKLSYDAEKIYVTSPWRRFRIIKWSDVISHSFSPIMNLHILHTAQGDCIRISSYVSGLRSLFQELIERKILIPSGTKT